MLKNNLFGQILIGIIVILLLIASIQLLGIGSQVSSVKLDESEQISIPKLPISINQQETQEEVDLKKLVEVATVKPIFSITREPFVGEVEEVPEEPPVAIAELKAQITGIVITSENSYAMILDTTTNKRSSYKVGMPLDGELGGWTITSIQSRKVTFISDDEKSEELELKVSGGTKPKIAAKASNNKTAAEAGKVTNPNKPLSRKDKKKNADDIRKKIAARRAQMRAEAANKKN
jgi:hypothetical protein